MPDLVLSPKKGGIVVRFYDTACEALAKARTVDEVRNIRDEAAAMQEYAKRAKNKILFADAWEVRERAERGVGEMMVAQYATVGKAKAGRPKKIGSVADPISIPPSLAAAGIDKHLADRGRTRVAIPKAEFEQSIAEGRARIIEYEFDRLDRRIKNAGARAMTRATPATVPEGKFDCIVVDPPWPMEKIERDVRPNQVGFDYPTMTEEELADLDIGSFAADDCHLFCWTTQRFLLAAFRLLEGWDFRYVCEFVWYKPGGFQPVGLPQFNCEFALYARLGTPRFISTKEFFTCFEAPRREHSRKPDKFYDLVRRVTAGPRIEVFSREKREGFAQYGNETSKFAGAA
jgi:N6-adenosine-specific RNA methylase IME4